MTDFSHQIMDSGMNAAVSKPFSTTDLMKEMWTLVNTREAALPQSGIQ